MRSRYKQNEAKCGYTGNGISKRGLPLTAFKIPVPEA